MNKDFYITLPNDIYNDISITNEELVVFSLIKRNYIQIKELALTSVNMIKQLIGVNNRNPRLVKTIRQAIVGLIDKEYIKNILNLQYDKINFKNIKNNDLFYIEIEPLLKQYFQIYDYDLDIIFKYLHKSNINRFNFIRYFIAIQRVISNDSRFGYLTQRSVKNICGEFKTIKKYNQILQDELKIIRYNNSYITPQKHFCSTYFGRYNDKINFNHQLKFEIESKNLIYIKK